MSEAKHTPGPWIHEGHGDITGTENGRKYDVACVYLRIPAGRQDANARLIAAAPDLLEALRMMLTEAVFDGTTGTDAARAAIAKATGKTQ